MSATHVVMVHASGYARKLEMHCDKMDCGWWRVMENSHVAYQDVAKIADEHEALNIPRGEVIE